MRVELPCHCKVADRFWEKLARILTLDVLILVLFQIFLSSFIDKMGESVVICIFRGLPFVLFSERSQGIFGIWVVNHIGIPKNRRTFLFLPDILGSRIIFPKENMGKNLLWRSIFKTFLSIFGLLSAFVYRRGIRFFMLVRFFNFVDHLRNIA